MASLLSCASKLILLNKQLFLSHFLLSSSLNLLAEEFIPLMSYHGHRLLMYKWQLRRRKSCLTQEELVKAYEGPDFDLADRYGEVSRA